MDAHADECVHRWKVRNEDDATFLRQVFYGCIRYKRLIGRGGLLQLPTFQLSLSYGRFEPRCLAPPWPAFDPRAVGSNDIDMFLEAIELTHSNKCLR